MTAGIAEPLARAVLFTGDAWIVADVPVGDRRLLDVLNDPTGTLLAVTAMRVADPADPERARLGHGPGRVRKDGIVCAAVVAEPPRPTERRLAVRVAKHPVRLTAIVPGLAIVGVLHVAGRLDPITAAFGGGEPFVAITSAGLVPLGTPLPAGGPDEPLTVLVNRARVVAAVMADPSVVPAAVRDRPLRFAASPGSPTAGTPAGDHRDADDRDDDGDVRLAAVRIPPPDAPRSPDSPSVPRRRLAAIAIERAR
jgi:hypothetical protein